jgi:hypothetical protein
MALRERERIERLNMTSTDDRRSRIRSHAYPEGLPVPQPVFIPAEGVPVPDPQPVFTRAESVPVPQPVFTRAEVDYIPPSTGWDVPLRHPVPQTAASSMREQFTHAGPSHLRPVMSRTVADDLFGPSPPSRYNNPLNVSTQNPTPVPQIYPQNVPQPQLEPYLNPQTQRWEYPVIRNIPNPMPPPQHVPYNAAYQQPQAHMGSVPVQAPMPPPQHVPYQHSTYYQHQAQMGSVSNAVPNVSAQHQTLRSVQSNPALNNVHRGHIAHREREAAYRQSLLDQEYILCCRNDHEISNWAVPDELNCYKENEGRRWVLVPD